MGSAAASFPYAHTYGAISVMWTVLPDGEGAAEEYIGSCQVDRTEAPQSAQLRIGITASIEHSIVSKLIGPDENSRSDLSMALLVAPGGSSPAARQRDALILDYQGEADGSHRWVGEWTSSRADLAGNLSMTPVLVRASKGSGEGLASFLGEEVASSEDTLKLLTFSEDRPPGGDIDARWIDFSEKRADHVGTHWLLEAKSGSDSPILFLDSGVEGFKNALEGESPLSEILIREIAVDVQVSLTLSLLAELIRDGDGGDSGLAFTEDDWRYRLLADSANWMFKDMANEEAIESLIAKFRDDPPWLVAELFARGLKHRGSRTAVQALTRAYGAGGA